MRKSLKSFELRWYVASSMVTSYRCSARWPRGSVRSTRRTLSVCAHTLALTAQTMNAWRFSISVDGVVLVADTALELEDGDGTDSGEMMVSRGYPFDSAPSTDNRRHPDSKFPLRARNRNSSM